MDTWAKLDYFVESGCEGRKVDLKRELTLDTAGKRAKFAKDVLAMANTAGGTGYLVIGVLDAKDRTGDDPAEYIVGFGSADPDAFQRRMLQALRTYCHPVPEIRYEEITHPTTERTLGVVVISRSFKQPHVVKADGQSLRADDIYVRRGPETFPASREDLSRMFGSQGETRILLNFGRPITPAQMGQIETLLGASIYEAIDVPLGFDDSLPYEPQVREKIRQAGLTDEDWNTLPLLINVHPFAPATALFLSAIHGLHGFFPELVRMRRVGNTNEFEVAELLDPQSLRNQAAREGIWS
jgi:hypothetical protein